MKRLFLIAVLAALAPALAQAQPLSLQARVARYDYDHYNTVVERQAQPLANGAARLALNMGQWQASLAQRPAANKAARDYVLTFSLGQGNSPQTSVAAQIDVANWSTENYVLLPGAAYNGNRFEWRRIGYSPKLLDPRDIGPDKPTIVTDIPKLDEKNGPSRMQERSGSMSVPAVGFYSPKQKKVVWVVFQQGNRLGDYGVTVEESRDRKTASIMITAPIVRELYKYRITDNRWPSDDRGHDFNQGDSVSIGFCIYEFSGSSIDDLHKHFVTVREEGYWPRPAQFNNLGFSACFDVQQRKFNRQNWVEQHGYYSVGMRENFLQDWQIGWTGGMISTYPLLFAGNDSTRQRVIRNFNWLFPNGIAPSGYFWDSGEKGTKWYGGDIRKPHTKNWHLVRKSGDGLYFVAKQFMLMQKQKQAIDPQWIKGSLTVADAFLKTWQQDKQLGNFVDSETGRVVVGGSASGGIVPAALMLTSQFIAPTQPDKAKAYRQAALEIGKHYYETATAKGLTTGGPGDAMQNPDSESAYALVESYMVLFEATNDRYWLQAAEEAARQYATWVSGYDYNFPPTSLFGRQGIKSTGAVGANTQNKHGAPGICTHSGHALLRLYRTTGNTFYAQLLRQTAHNMTQYLGHPAKPIEKVNEGWMCERVSTTDWLEGIGEITYQSTWAETALMLTYIEVPGVYVNTSTGQAIAFDHVEVQARKKGKGTELTITNPTKTPLAVKVWAEDASALSKALDPVYLTGARIVNLKAGEKKTLNL